MEQRNKVGVAIEDFEGGEIREEPKTPVKEVELTSPSKGKDTSSKKLVEETEEEKAEKEK